MVCTQIQFEESQLEALRRLSAERKRSVPDLVRESVARTLVDASRASRIRRALNAAGKFSSGHSDVSQNHDRFLGDAFLKYS
jgi:hypothetical protein